ncbi:dual-specificity RNA methyltransferase RlmN [Striga asiatica]|uniref:Dual-specificity RNA methyltransferase RlmN n=1 Tax=Striga asiatica TaxID=4170 RepID=A0A5A7QLZ0_STRAF|nr:dual-specificity RNA methyltransferase RlmN [Striga asiatica]
MTPFSEKVPMITRGEHQGRPRIDSVGYQEIRCVRVGSKHFPDKFVNMAHEIAQYGIPILHKVELPIVFQRQTISNSRVANVESRLSGFGKGIGFSVAVSVGVGFGQSLVNKFEMSESYALYPLGNRIPINQNPFTQTNPDLPIIDHQLPIIKLIECYRVTYHGHATPYALHSRIPTTVREKSTDRRVQKNPNLITPWDHQPFILSLVFEPKGQGISIKSVEDTFSNSPYEAISYFFNSLLASVNKATKRDVKNRARRLGLEPPSASRNMISQYSSKRSSRSNSNAYVGTRLSGFGKRVGFSSAVSVGVDFGQLMVNEFEMSESYGKALGGELEGKIYEGVNVSLSSAVPIQRDKLRRLHLEAILADHEK